jgi:DNA-binding response OmpR family regulator
VPRILLIEDDQRLAEMVSRYLGEAGFDITHASSGGAGITRARHRRDPDPDADRAR